LPAKVIGLAGKMRLDKGQEDGVKEGMMVVSENILVGKVIRVERKNCLVEVLSDPVVKIPVVVKKTLKGETEAIRAAEGIQARGLYQAGPKGKGTVKEILQAEDVQKGDLVLTSGEAGWLPTLLIGQVEEVLGSQAAVYKEAWVEPLVDEKKLEIVFIVIDW